MTFTLLAELGRGGMGVVWRARDEESGQIVALKLLRAAYADDPDYLERFTRELELTRRIHSAHVVAVLGYGVREGVPYLALEYVDGPSLRERLTEGGPYAWPEARGLLAQVAQGLADAHAAGVVHRDVKPSNILLGSDGIARLTDFGVSRGLDLTRVTGTSTMLGTPAYLAPEGPADERSDLYSLGCVAYELLAGAVPFEGRSYQEVILRHVREAPDLAKLPAEARPIVGALLAKDPAQRPQSAAELVGLLEGTGSLSAAAAPARVTPTPTAPRRRRRGALLAAALTALAVLLLAVGTGLTAHPGPSPSPGIPAASLAAVVGSAGPSLTVTPGSSGTPASVSLYLTASGISFDKTDLTAPAGVPFQIMFTNNDAGIPHNVVIHKDSPTGEVVFSGRIFSGVATQTYDVPALPAGTYGFACGVHPNMTGTLTVKAGSLGPTATATATPRPTAAPTVKPTPRPTPTAPPTLRPTATVVGIVGALLDSRGSPVAGIPVAATPAGQAYNPTFATSDGFGKFTIKLTPGEYNIEVDGNYVSTDWPSGYLGNGGFLVADPGQAIAVRVIASAGDPTPVTVRFPTFFRISGTVRSSSGASLDRLGVDACGAHVICDNLFRLPSTGVYSMSVLPADYSLDVCRLDASNACMHYAAGPSISVTNADVSGVDMVVP